jgi:hypothetical protein
MSGIAEPKKGEGPLTEEMRLLLQRAQDGDPSVLPQLRELLDGRPELWRRFGDLAGHVKEALLSLAGGKSLLVQESLRREMLDLWSELAGPSPSRVVKLLADRVVICWAQCHLADLDALQKERGGAPQAAHAERRQSAAQTRYLAALKQLEVVRRLVRPPLSPLDLARRPVEETAGPPAALRARAGVAPDGVPVAN